MSGDLTLTITNLDPLLARLNGASAIVQAELGTSMKRVTAQVEGTAKEISPVDTGTYRSAWTVTSATAALGVVSNNVPYAPEIEYGRGAGKPMPPEGALLGWMGRHGIPAEAEFVVRRSIGQIGIGARKIANLALARNVAGIQAEFQQAGQRIAQKVAGG